MQEKKDIIDIDIAIIGGGPSGITAAIYATRSGFKTILFEGTFVGGQAVSSHLIENYPGFVGGVSGAELGEKMEKQAKQIGVEIVKREIKKVEFSQEIKTISTSKQTYRTKVVIIATGSVPRKMGIEKEDELSGVGVSYCATCDGGFFKGKNVAVVGGGETALGDAAYLARIVKQVYIVHRRDAFRAAQSSVDLALKFDNIKIVWDSVVTRLVAEKTLTALEVENVKTKQKTQLEIDGVFVAIGSDPKTTLFQNQIELKDGSIVVDKLLQTSVKGVYAAGDVVFESPKQVITGAGEGAICAINAAKYLSGLM